MKPLNGKKLARIFNSVSFLQSDAFDAVFVRQPDDVSCAPAVMTTACRLYGIDPLPTFEQLRRDMGTGNNGTHLDKIIETAEKYLPVTSRGRNRYAGGTAIGSIRHKTEGALHCVLFLARTGDHYVYYDPMDHKIYRDHVRNMSRLDRRSRSDQSWNLHYINLPPLAGTDADFWLKYATDNPFKLKEQVFWQKAQKKKIHRQSAR